MPINKNAYIRYRVIDTLLRNKDFVKTIDVVDKLWSQHDLKVASRTINKDMTALETDFQAPIEYDSAKRAYYYPENVAEIFPSLDLQEDEINALKFYAKIMQQYKEFDVFKDFKNAIDKVVDAVNIKSAKSKTNSKIIIQPEDHPKFKGSELIPQIMSGFNKNQKFQFDYLKHVSDEHKNYTVTPILLKEYDGLWYLITQVEEKIKMFALDRIFNFRLADEECDEINDFDSDQYFDHAFGIAVSNGQVEEVILEFDAWRGKYLLSSPIHKSQELVEETSENIVLKFKVVPYHELHAKILSYGNHVRVLAPESLKLTIKELLEETLKKY
jgi:predicted DNA-binding transcriptional regulator YafY